MYVPSSKHSNGADWLTTLSIQPAMIWAGSKATVEAVAVAAIASINVVVPPKLTRLTL